MKFRFAHTMPPVHGLLSSSYSKYSSSFQVHKKPVFTRENVRDHASWRQPFLNSPCSYHDHPDSYLSHAWNNSSFWCLYISLCSLWTGIGLIIFVNEVDWVSRQAQHLVHRNSQRAIDTCQGALRSPRDPWTLRRVTSQ